MKKFVSTFLVLLFSLGAVLSLSGLAFAAAPSSATEGLNKLGTDTNQNTGQGSEAHPKASTRPGANSISSAFLFISDYITYITAGLGTLYLILAFTKLITAGATIDEAITKQKTTIMWIIIGFLIIVIADELVFNIFFGRELGGVTQPGEGYNDPTSVRMVSKEFGKELGGLINAVEFFVVYLAVLVAVISGVRMIAQSSNEEAVTSAKKHLMYAALGLIIIGISEGLVYVFYPQEQGQFNEKFDAKALLQLFSNITTFVASFIGLMAISGIMYAGFLYVAYYGQDDQIEKAKKIITTSIIGLFIAAMAYGMARTLVLLDGTA